MVITYVYIRSGMSRAMELGDPVTMRTICNWIIQLSKEGKDAWICDWVIYLSEIKSGQSAFELGPDKDNFRIKAD